MACSVLLVARDMFCGNVERSVPVEGVGVVPFVV